MTLISRKFGKLPLALSYSWGERRLGKGQAPPQGQDSAASLLSEEPNTLLYWTRPVSARSASTHADSLISTAPPPYVPLEPELPDVVLEEPAEQPESAAEGQPLTEPQQIPAAVIKLQPQLLFHIETHDPKLSS